MNFMMILELLRICRALQVVASDSERPQWLGFSIRKSLIQHPSQSGFHTGTLVQSLMMQRRILEPGYPLCLGRC